ncbi:unnamed protein product [Mycena citricolor]|uniref:Uncharacterized protein n=1 Tax=Mycena citricolor TaxID=2018698 RepID=A0AAD2HRY5_9AGAR|nr:unnamed protein product [Mycena citricolor]
MPVLPTRKEMQEMKRPELQKLCKDYGVKANLKTEALIELLLDTRNANPRMVPIPAPPAVVPAARRSVSTRQSSRSTAPRISSVIIHDTDDEDESGSQGTNVEETENHPEPEPEPMPTRTRKAKETQTRLGMGRPVVAGGSGARAVTKSMSIAKGKRGKSIKIAKPVQETIVEEGDEEQPEAGPSKPQSREIIPQSVHELESAETRREQIASVITDQLAPILEQLKSFKTEAEQVPGLKAEIAELHKQVADVKLLQEKVSSLAAQLETLSAQSVGMASLRAEFEQWKMTDRAPGTGVADASSGGGIENDSNMSSSSNSRTAGMIKRSDMPAPGVAPQLLGKRHRDSSSSDLTGVIEDGEEGQLNADELAKLVTRPTKKRPKLQDDSAMDAEDVPTPPRVPSFTVYSGEEESYVDPPPPMEGLPAFYGASSSGTTTSTRNASENQHPFNYAFLPLTSTPSDSLFALPSFPFPEAPTSPTPTGPNQISPSRDTGRTDIFEPFGLPSPSRPRSRVTSLSSRDGSFVDPSVISHRPSEKEREELAASFGFKALPRLPGEPDGQASRTMYGTELDSDTRFGDFGVEGVASSGFWAGSRF